MDQIAFIPVRDVNLASALDALGCPRFAEKDADHFYDPIKRKLKVEFRFEVNDRTTRLVKLWNSFDPKKDFWIEATAEQLIEAFRLFVARRELALDFINHGKITVVAQEGGGLTVRYIDQKEVEKNGN